MAKNLGIHTVAEGMEYQEQHDFLRSIGCEALQGFLFSRPLSKEKFIEYLEGHPMIAEPEEEKEYWNRIGSLNPLSGTPLESFSHDPLAENVKKTESFIEAPLAIIEIGDNSVAHVYASNEYLKNIRELGYPSIQKLEHAYNERIPDQYLILKRMIMNAIRNDAVQELDYIRNNIYYSIRTRCLAKLPDKATIALQLTIFETENRTKTTDEMMRYSGALFGPMNWLSSSIRRKIILNGSSRGWAFSPMPRWVI